MIKIYLEKIYTVSARYPKYKWMLTPIIGGIFSIVTALFVIIPVQIEKIFHIPAFWSSPLNYILSFPLILTGAVLMLWTSLIFFMTKGTPVPVNPPPQLVVKGPYQYMRNPMHGGMFLLMFGFGIYYCSPLAIIVFIPLYIYMDIKILKKIEEPELEKRLGRSYIEYKKITPMFFPKSQKGPKTSE